MEVDIDVGSSSVAATVVGLVQGATKSLVVDMGIVLEGHTRDELPESLLGTVRRPLLFPLQLLSRVRGLDLSQSMELFFIGSDFSESLLGTVRRQAGVMNA